MLADAIKLEELDDVARNRRKSVDARQEDNSSFISFSNRHNSWNLGLANHVAIVARSTSRDITNRRGDSITTIFLSYRSLCLLANSFFPFCYSRSFVSRQRRSSGRRDSSCDSRRNQWGTWEMYRADGERCIQSLKRRKSRFSWWRVTSRQTRTGCSSMNTNTRAKITGTYICRRWRICTEKRVW